jgi:molybdenum cofactor cytidylyltransferase
MSVAAIVLAAGSSSRMGRPKQVLPVGGKSLVRRAVEAAIGSTGRRTIVVTGEARDQVEAELEGLPVQIVHNPDYQQGMSTSLRAGLAALPADAEAVVVLLADQPFVDASVVDSLIGHYQQKRSPIVRPRYAGEPGNPVLWDHSLFDALAAQTGDQGGRTLLREHASEIAWLDLPDARQQFDVDTPEAYAQVAEEPPPAADHNHDSAERFCQRCGRALEIRPVRYDHDRPRPTCPACGYIVWSDPKVAVLAVIPWDGGILLGRRSMNPGKGRWSFPSGFADRGEPLEEAIQREVREETGLDVDVVGLVGVYSARGNPVVVVAYAAEPRSSRLTATDDLAELQGFPADNLPDLAFSHDERIVRDWLALRSRLTRASR